MRKLKLVHVTWGDAWFNADADFTDEELAHTPLVTHTVGWLLKRDKTGVTLVWEYDEDGGKRSEYFIPQGMILAVEVVRVEE